MTTFLSNPLAWWNVENTSLFEIISSSNFSSSSIGIYIGMSFNFNLILFSN